MTIEYGVRILLSYPPIITYISIGYTIIKYGVSSYSVILQKLYKYTNNTTLFKTTSIKNPNIRLPSQESINPQHLQFINFLISENIQEMDNILQNI